MDLNVDAAVLTRVPRTVLACDALIDVPVMKTIQAVGMTCAMKNFVGTAPGRYYGRPKLGGPHGPGIPHTVRCWTRPSST